MERINKDWIKSSFRSGIEYQEGVQVFIQFAIDHAPSGITTCTCPCKSCNNSKRLPFKNVEKHLIINGMHPMYTEWFLHGEKSGMNSMDIPAQVVENHIDKERNINANSLHDLVDVAYNVHNEMETGDYRSDEFINQTSEIPKEFLPQPNLDSMYHEYKKKATEKLYTSCETSDTTLSVIIELHNLKKQFNWSGNSMTELLKCLTRWLPKGNTLPDKYPTMKKILKDLGMKAKCIHACPNNCILYWKEHESATECPLCQAPRFKVKEKKSGKVRNESNEPMKVLRHFPLIPRLKRLYTIPSLARHMTWHKRAESSWDFM